MTTTRLAAAAAVAARINFSGVDPYGGASLPLECRRPEGRGSTRKKTVPIRLLEQSKLFVMTKLLDISFRGNADQLSIDSLEDTKIA